MTVCTLAVAACGDESITPLGLSEVQPGVLELRTTCADGVTAAVDETSDEIRITEVDGRVVNGDCEGIVTITLDAPLDERPVVVEGELWVDQSGRRCSWGSLGPSDLPEVVASPVCEPP